MKLSIILPLLATALLLGACHSAQTTKNDTTVSGDVPHIVFLHIRMTDSSVTLLDKSVEPGMLKQKRFQEESPNGIHYDVTSSSGEVLWQEIFDDPLVKHLEYEDPDHPGQIKSKIVRSGEAELTLRIPFTAGQSYIDFYRVAISQSGESTRKLLGRIELSFTGDSTR